MQHRGTGKRAHQHSETNRRVEMCSKASTAQHERNLGADTTNSCCVHTERQAGFLISSKAAELTRKFGLEGHEWLQTIV